MLISLGYSCQTRFMIDALSADQKRQPFDFNITSRPALIKAFETNGASLQHGESHATTFIMPKERREGIEVSGMYFWHDYPLQENKLSLHHDWRTNMDRVNSKYTALWARFSELVRSDEPKTFVLSNSQHNLPEFTSDAADFDRKFGLGRQAFEEIIHALDSYGARNYRLKFLSRSVGDLEETASLRDDRLDHRFVGVLSLRVDPRIVTSLFSGAEETGVDDLDGAYDNADILVKAISSNTALVFRRSEDKSDLWGSIACTDGGFIAAFQGRDQIFTAVRDGQSIQFSNGTRWEKAS